MANLEENQKSKILIQPKRNDTLTQIFHIKGDRPIIKKYPDMDVARATPEAELMRARRDLIQAENELKEKWKEQEIKKIDINQQWSDLRNKENSLRQSFIEYNKLVKENREKRERAEKKISDEEERQKLREKEILDLKKNIEKFSEARDKMKNYVNDYKIYQNYLEKVVNETNEFQSIPEIFNRYETLIEAKELLSENQDKSLAILEEASKNMHEMTQTKTNMLMDLSNELAQLQGRYDRAKALAIRWETIVARIKASAAVKNSELTQMRACCWNLYSQICKRKGIAIELDPNDYEQQLLQIKRTILEVKRIIKVAKKKATKPIKRE
ncbi:coiled-coil domain-containing protein 42 homolog [Leptopilina boulardi]|uniref:coiled-coil domain-containing protein 42 homolog n=1 Tax=Leptopilina boulardi TaxID=63433 RepID=UPI0021F679AD|nr:coiled-coil domain-containing protein 42 homolog [Leptopilina boulardi]